MEDYGQIEFHQLQDLHDKSITADIGFEGFPCVDCKEHCPGFHKHGFRHVCAHCKCAPSRHDLVSSAIGHPFTRMNLEEKDAPDHTEYVEAAHEGFAWVPRGLKSAQIETYFKKVDHKMVSKGEEGVLHREAQLIKQLPLQDFHFDHLHFVSKNSENVFKFIAKKRLQDAVGVGAVKATLTGSGHCSGCHEKVGPLDMVVVTEKLGEEHYWHPGCFRCHHDNEPLVDMIYFAHQDRIFCGRHYHEQIKPRCFGCDELVIKGGYIKAMGAAWHNEHFCCWGCDKHLEGETYLPSGDQPMCEDCYNRKHGHVCTNCHEYIGAGCKDLLVRDLHFHENCFTCSQCNELLKNAEFSFMEENIVCHQCRGIDVEKCKHCYHCHAGFENGQKKVGVGGEYYHEWCFTCTDCTNPISTKTFIRKADDRQLCNDCFLRTAKVCDGCDVAIKGPTLNMGERYFHADCFNCFHCSKHLDGSPERGDGHHSDGSDSSWDNLDVKNGEGVQFYKHDEEPYCEDCYLSQHAKRCGQCFSPICASTKYVEYDNKYWHSTCFACSSCELALAGGVKFVARDGDRFCVDCK